MSTPPSSTAINWLATASERLQELQDQLQQRLPGEVYAFLRAHPEIESIRWKQSSMGREGFSLWALDFDFSQENTPTPLVESASLAFEGFETFLRAVPSCVMVELFGHSHRVRFEADNFETDYTD